MALAFSVDGITMSWTETCEYAAEIGDVDLLMYAYKKGGKITEKVYDNVIRYGYETGDDSCFKYINEHAHNMNNLMDCIDNMVL